MAAANREQPNSVPALSAASDSLFDPFGLVKTGCGIGAARAYGRALTFCTDA